MSTKTSICTHQFTTATAHRQMRTWCVFVLKHKYTPSIYIQHPANSNGVAARYISSLVRPRAAQSFCPSISPIVNWYATKKPLKPSNSSEEIPPTWSFVSQQAQLGGDLCPCTLVNTLKKFLSKNNDCAFNKTWANFSTSIQKQYTRHKSK